MLQTLILWLGPGQALLFLPECPRLVENYTGGLDDL